MLRLNDSTYYVTKNLWSRSKNLNDLQKAEVNNQFKTSIYNTVPDNVSAKVTF